MYTIGIFEIKHKHVMLCFENVLQFTLTIGKTAFMAVSIKNSIHFLFRFFFLEF